MQQKTNKQLMEIRMEHVPQGPFNITPIFVKQAKGALIENGLSTL
ncbi:MAG: hypothetical protein ABIL06_24565 [Pseudomonadota bacterium]